MEACANKRICWIGPLRSYPYTIAALLVYAGMFIPFMTLRRDWETCTVVEGVRMCAGDTIYGHDDLYPYPPLPAFLAVPFAHLPFLFGQVLFYSLNLACLVLMVCWSWLLTGGGRLQGCTVSWREHAIMLLGLMCSFTFALNCLAHHQIDLVIGAAMIGGCLALARGRTYLGAVGFGLAAALKGPALLWAPYLVWRGRWKEAVCVFVVFLGLNLLPSFVVPAQFQRLDREGLLLAEWAGRFLQPMGQSADYPHFWYSQSNQSLLGGGYRWLCTTWGWSNGWFQQRLPLTNPASPAELKAFYLTWAGLLMAWTIFLQGRRNLADVVTADGASLQGAAAPTRFALECGTVFVLMLLLSPMSGKAHFGTMLVPALAVARLAVNQGSGVLRIILALALVAVLCSQNFMGDRFVCVSMWYGTVMWAALLLWVGCGLALTREAASGPQS